MGWLFGTSEKKLARTELDELLKRIPSLDANERAYVEGVFARYLTDGISRQEIEQAVRALKLNTSDAIDPNEAETIRNTLLAAL